MKAGFGKACVNPPLGMPMEGLGQAGGCQSIHDDLFVRVLALSHGGVEMLVIGCDLLFFERAVIDRFKGAIGRVADIPAARILFNVSHNHSGPRLTRWAYSGAPAEFYLDRIEAALLAAVTEARSRMEDVTLHAGVTRTDLPVSRRKLDAADRAQWAPAPGATVCDALPVCVLRANDGRIVSLLFSVSCHPSIYYETIITAEYPGAAAAALNSHFRTEGSLFLQGAGGDTKPRPIADPKGYWRRGSLEDVAAAGHEVAAAVIACVEKGLRPVEPDLRAFITEMRWPLQPPPSRAELEEIADSDPNVTPENKPGAPSAQRRLWARDMLERLSRDDRLPDHALVLLHAMQLGRGGRLGGLEGEAVG